MKRLMCLLVFGLFAVSNISAQTTSKAYFSSDEGIMIPLDEPLADKYEIDISAYNWNEDNAKVSAKYFDDKSDLISMEVDFENSKFLLKLDLTAEKSKDWDMKKWNEHLRSIL